MSSCDTSAILNNQNLPSNTFGAPVTICERFASNVYLADDKFVGIRVFFNLCNLSDDDLVKICIELLSYPSTFDPESVMASTVAGRKGWQAKRSFVQMSNFFFRKSIRKLSSLQVPIFTVLVVYSLKKACRRSSTFCLISCAGRNVPYKKSNMLIRIIFFILMEYSSL